MQRTKRPESQKMRQSKGQIVEERSRRSSGKILMVPSSPKASFNVGAFRPYTSKGPSNKESVGLPPAPERRTGFSFNRNAPEFRPSGQKNRGKDGREAVFTAGGDRRKRSNKKTTSIGIKHLIRGSDEEEEYIHPVDPVKIPRESGHNDRNKPKRAPTYSLQNRLADVKVKSPKSSKARLDSNKEAVSTVRSLEIYDSEEDKNYDNPPTLPQIGQKEDHRYQKQENAHAFASDGNPANAPASSHYSSTLNREASSIEHLEIFDSEEDEEFDRPPRLIRTRSLRLVHNPEYEKSCRRSKEPEAIPSFAPFNLPQPKGISIFERERLRLQQSAPSCVNRPTTTQENKGPLLGFSRKRTELISLLIQ